MAKKATKTYRQTFGPNETDLNLCFFVCWDESPDPEDGIGDRWAHFNDKEDAVEFFALKSKDETVHVWTGELGISEVDGHFDWFYTGWSSNLSARLGSVKPGMGYRWSSDALEKFIALDLDDEEDL